MTRLRIVIFSKFFWPKGGGAELATYFIVKEILSKYFDMVIVSGTERPETDILRCCKYIYWPVLKSRYKPVEWLKLFANSKTVRELVEWSDVVYIPSHTLLPLAIAARVIKPSVKVVIHLHNYQPLTYASVVLAWREPDLVTDIIVEHGEHSSIVRTILTGAGHYINIVNRLALYHADKIICVSRRQLEIMSKHIPTLRSKAMVIYNPPPLLPRDFEKKPSPTPSILYAGGGSFVKGFHLAIKALVRVATRKSCRVYLAGAFMDKERRLLERLRKKLYGKIVVLGRIPHSKLVKLYKASWASLFPSICEEPLPYAVVESCLLGTLPLAARVGGVPEIVEGTPAEKLLFEPKDVEDLSSKVETVLSMSREELMTASCRLREICVRRFDRGRIARKILNLFTSL